MTLQTLALIDSLIFDKIILLLKKKMGVGCLMILFSGNMSANLILPHTEWRVQREKRPTGWAWPYQPEEAAKNPSHMSYASLTALDY